MGNSGQFDLVLVALIVQYVVGVIADAMEPPVETDGRLYRFLYRFMHGLSANWSRLRELKGRRGA